MSSRTLFRLSGVILLIGFLLILIGQLLQLALPPMSDVGKHYTDPLFLPSYLFFWSGAILQVIGLPGLYARIAEKIGVLGLFGFVLTFFGLLVVEISIDLAELVVFPPLAANAQSLPVLKMLSLPLGVFASLLLLFLGTLLFGIATLRGRALPRGVGIVLIIAAILSFASLAVPLIDPLGVLLAHFAFAYGGFVLVRENFASVARTPPVSPVPSLP